MLLENLHWHEVDPKGGTICIYYGDVDFYMYLQKITVNTSATIRRNIVIIMIKVSTRYLVKTYRNDNPESFLHKSFDLLGQQIIADNIDESCCWIVFAC